MKTQAFFACVFALPGFIHAQINLGSAASFGVLGATTVTNTGLTVIDGSIGVSPGTAITGFPPGIYLGTIESADAAAAAAQSAAMKAYAAAAALAPTRDLTGQDLGGMILLPGVYHFSSSAQLTGILTLNGNNNPNAQFIFQIGSTLTTASLSAVLFINGAQECNIFWQIGSSATLGTGTLFAGNLVALTAITATTGTAVNGSLIALNAAVTLDTNLIFAQPVCGSPAPPVSSSVTSTTSTSTATSCPVSTVIYTVTSAGTMATCPSCTPTSCPTLTPTSCPTLTSSSCPVLYCPSSSTQTSSSTLSHPMTTSTTKSSTVQSTKSSTSCTKSSTSSATKCTSTAPAPTCDYHCGKWCSKPLGSFKQKSDCLAAVKVCSDQVSVCLAEAGSSASKNCAGFANWCTQVSLFCSAECPGTQCSKGGCYSKYPPLGAPAQKSGVCTVGY